jgi:hypothetical protein
MTESMGRVLRYVPLTMAIAGAALLPATVAVRAQAPVKAPAPTPSAPVGNAAQLMRGIFFPNSNLIFTVQTIDPAAPPKPAASATQQSDAFSVAAWGAGIYTGWQVVDNAAIALIDVSPLILAPGLKCENGRDAPVTDPDWIRFTNDMIAVAKKTYAASREKNRDLVSELTGDLSDSCTACHRVYRDVRPPRGQAAGPGAPDSGRCQSRRP